MSELSLWGFGEGGVVLTAPSMKGGVSKQTGYFCEDTDLLKRQEALPSECADGPLDREVWVWISGTQLVAVSS